MGSTSNLQLTAKTSMPFHEAGPLLATGVNPALLVRWDLTKDHACISGESESFAAAKLRTAVTDRLISNKHMQGADEPQPGGPLGLALSSADVWQDSRRRGLSLCGANSQIGTG